MRTGVSVTAGVLGLLAATSIAFLLNTRADVSLAAAILYGANTGAMVAGGILRGATYTRSHALAALNRADRREVRRALRDGGLVDPRLMPVVLAEADEMSRVRRFPSWLQPGLTVLGAVLAAGAGVVDVVLGPTPLVAFAGLCTVLWVGVLPGVVREPKRFANAELARKYALAANRG